MGEYSTDATRRNVLRAIEPLGQPQSRDFGPRRLMVFSGIPHNEYYLIFLMLVDLLGFQYLGPSEKIAYIIPVDFEGRRYSIVYAKFGLKIEYREGGNGEAVYETLKRAMRAAKPYFL